MATSAVILRGVARSIGLIGFAWLIGSCGDSVTGPPPPTTDRIAISAPTATLVPASSIQLSATALDRAGTALPRVFSWSSSDVAKATVSNTGSVAGVAPGTATITASVDGKSATSTVTVLDGGGFSSSGATVSLRSGTLQIVVPSDALAQPTNLSVVPSTAFANDPRVVKETPFDFGPSGTTFAKPVTIRLKYAPTNLPQGTEEAALEIHLSTGSGWQPIAGSTVDLTNKTVSAEVSHFSVYAILTPGPVAAVTIRGPPDKPPIVNGASTLFVGDAEQLTATATDSQGEVLSNRTITWGTSDPTVGSISPDGLLTALKPGPTTITASAGGVTSNVNVTVAPIPVAAVMVTPATANVIAGKTTQLSVQTSDANHNLLTGRAVTWSSSDGTVATVDGDGLASAHGVGAATITATSEGKSGSAVITVMPVPVASVNVALAPSSITAVETSQATATILDENGVVLTGRSVSWSSDNAAVATVSAQGVVTALTVGTAHVTATSESQSGSATI